MFGLSVDNHIEGHYHMHSIIRFISNNTYNNLQLRHNYNYDDTFGDIDDL